MQSARRGSFLGTVYGHQVWRSPDEPTSGIISMQNVMDIYWRKVRITGKLWALCITRFDSIFHCRASTKGHLYTTASPYINSCFKPPLQWLLWRGSCLVLSARPMRFGSRGLSEIARASPTRSSGICHRNELTEKAWENAAEGLGKRGSSVILKKPIWMANDAVVP